MENREIAMNIIETIKTLDRFAMMSWGAKNLTIIKNGLRFKSSGLVKHKGFVTITLNGLDLYDVEFGRVRKCEYKTVSTVSNIYFDNLIFCIDEMVK